MQVTMPNVNTDYYTNNVAIGGSGGSEFSFNVPKVPDSGKTVLSIQAWYNDTIMRGFEVGLTDGQIKMFGKRDGYQTEKFFFSNKEKVTSLKLWATDDKRTGRMEVTTDQGRRFLVNVSTKDSTQFDYDIGCGLMMGVFGRRGIDIDCIGFAMLHRITKSELFDVKYPGVLDLKIKTQPKEIKTVVYDNTQSSVDQKFTFEGKETVETSQEWSVTAGIEAGVSVEVSGGIPILAEGSVEAHVNISVESTYSQSSTNTHEQTYNFEVNAPAGKKVKATAILYEGKIDTKYTAKMRITLDTLKVIEYNVSGTYDGISSSEVDVKTKTIKN